MLLYMQYLHSFSRKILDESNSLQAETLAAYFQSGLSVLKAPSALFDLYVDK